jgi:hypothetical protein
MPTTPASFKTYVILTSVVLSRYYRSISQYTYIYFPLGLAPILQHCFVFATHFWAVRGDVATRSPLPSTLHPRFYKGDTMQRRWTPQCISREGTKLKKEAGNQKRPVPLHSDFDRLEQARPKGRMREAVSRPADALEESFEPG